jgi:hypothetical protein
MMSVPAASPFSSQHIHRWIIWMVGMSAMSAGVAVVVHLAQLIPIPGAWRIVAGVALACCGPGLFWGLHVVTFKPWCADSRWRGTPDYGFNDALVGLCIGMYTFGWLFLLYDVVFGSHKGGAITLLFMLGLLIGFWKLALLPGENLYNPRRVITAAGAGLAACHAAWGVGVLVDRLLMVAPTAAVALAGGCFGLVYAVVMLLGLPWSLGVSPQRKN